MIFCGLKIFPELRPLKPLFNFMSFPIKNLLKESYQDVHRPKLLIAVLILAFLAAALYPSDNKYYSDNVRINKDTKVAVTVEDYLRFINTASQVLIPIILMDKIGMVQAIYVGIATTASVQTLKPLFNHVTILESKIGQRPRGKKGNMPSGHSAMASSAMYFVMRRYGMIHGIYMIAITLLTMYARFMLDVHTISAVLAGFTIGILCAVLFTSAYKKQSQV